MSQGSGPNQIYDLSPDQREILEWRAQRRAVLRQEYLREIHNPNNPNEGHHFDPQMQRFYSTRFAFENLHKPTVKNFLWFAFLSVGVIGSFTYWFKKQRDAVENQYRTGQVSYRDRQFKFA